MKKASLTTCAGHSVSWLFSVMLVSPSMTTAMAQPTTVQVQPGIEVKDGNLEFRQFGDLEITELSIVRKEQTKTLPVQVIRRKTSNAMA